MEQAHICRFERQMVVKAHIYCWKKNSSILTQVPHSLKELLLKSQPLQKLLLQYQVKSNNLFVFSQKASANKPTRSKCFTSSQSSSRASLLVACAASASQQPASMSCWYMFPKSSRICLRICGATQTLVKKIREKLKRKPKEKIQEFR